LSRARVALPARSFQTHCLGAGRGESHGVALGLRQYPRSFAFAPGELVGMRVTQLGANDREGSLHLLTVPTKPSCEFAWPRLRHSPNVAGRSVVADMPRPVMDLGRGRPSLWLRPEIERCQARQAALGKTRPRRGSTC
jgi:hypothetical protein